MSNNLDLLIRRYLSSRNDVYRKEEVAKLFREVDSNLNNLYDLSSYRLGKLKLQNSVSILCINADEYYPIEGLLVPLDDYGFKTYPDGSIEVTEDSIKFPFVLTGTSDLSVDKLCVTTYSLFKDNGYGYQDVGYITPHTFAGSSRIENISISDTILLKKGDKLKVYVKSNQANTQVVVETLTVVLKD